MPSDDEVFNILSLGKNLLGYSSHILTWLTIEPLYTDGGGVRVLSEVMILDRIMKRIQEKQGLAETPKPCDYFHLIGGIGTGG